MLTVQAPLLLHWDRLRPCQPTQLGFPTNPALVCCVPVKELCSIKYAALPCLRTFIFPTTHQIHEVSCLAVIKYTAWRNQRPAHLRSPGWRASHLAHLDSPPVSNFLYSPGGRVFGRAAKMGLRCHSATKVDSCMQRRQCTYMQEPFHLHWTDFRPC